jgi:class 3 adenylate cyclase
MPRLIAVEATLTLRATPQQLWPFVADTSRVDRAIGLPPARFTRTLRAEGGETVVGEYRVLGWPLARWTEHPFEWERPRRYAILREYQRGPLVRYSGGVELLPAPAGTRLRVFSQFVPRHWLFVPLVRFVLAPLTLRRACRQYRAIAAFLAGQAADPFPDLVRQRTPTDLARLDALLARLEATATGDRPLPPPGTNAQHPDSRLGRGLRPQSAVRSPDHLRRLLAEAADEDVAGMRPLELAARWGTDPRQTLELFLRATVAGLVELRWELRCPGCRGVKAEAAHLRELAAGSVCPACNLHVAASLDEAIEARFYPAPAVRPVQLGAYCVGHPMLTPHRLAQAVLAPGETRAWQLTLAPGPYHLSSPQSRGTVRLEAAPAGGDHGVPDTASRALPQGVDSMAAGNAGRDDRLAVDVESLIMVPEEARVAAGSVTIHLHNTTARRVTVALDDARWAETGATPGRLMTLPAFRALFSAEALAPGVELAIGRVGLVFTDLAGSTALYERAGEARAFRLVGEHFTLLRRAVEEAGGAVVKTIGDAVMAAFPDGRSALSAGLALQRAIRSLDTGGLADPARLLKVGVHAGACYAVTLNERLDYFGTAVNLAARAQHEARGGEVVATAAVVEEAPELVAAAGIRTCVSAVATAAPFAVSLKGLDAPVRLYRIDTNA